MAVRRKSARQRFFLEDASPSRTEWETPEPSVSYSKFRTKRLQTRLEEIEDTLYQLKVRFRAWRLLGGSPVNRAHSKTGSYSGDGMRSGSNHGRRSTKRNSERARIVKAPPQKPKIQSGSAYAGELIPLFQSDPFWPPIENPQKERQILERRGQMAWMRWLWQRYGITKIGLSDRDFELRVCEIYRLCFVATGGSNLSVLADFAAHYPGVALQCPWIQKLARLKARIRDFDPEAKRFFTTLGLGFRRAGVDRSWQRRSALTRIESARVVQKSLKQELSDFRKGPHHSEASRDWLTEEMAKKAHEIAEAYPRLVNQKNKIISLLTRGKIYEASVLIASKTFQVRERDIKTSIRTL